MSVRTTEQEREHKRAQRARRRAAQAEMVVRPIHAVMDDERVVPASSVPAPGEYELLVKAELDALGDLADRMSGQAGNAIAMARILDNPAAILQHTAAAGQLRAQLALLQEAAKASRSKSNSVRMLRAKHVG